MRPPRSRRRHGAVVILAAALAALGTGQTLGAPAASAAPPAPAPSTAVATAQDQAARAIAGALRDPAFRARLRTAALGSEEVPVTRLAGSALKPALTAADHRIAAAKGLDGQVGSLLRLRLGDDSMRPALTAGSTPWVAAAASDDDTAAVTAYDSLGRAHPVDARTAPAHPVYVVDIDGDQALAAGLRVLGTELHRLGVASRTPAPTAARPARQAAPRAATAASGFWTTRITAVELNDDEEPWVKGDAEIYALVTGFGQDGKVRVDPVDMPYLDNDGTVYRPNQILVNWSNYKYDLADAVMMEEDGSTNYRDLAKAIATALLTITDQGAYIPLVNAVLDAIPDDWWTDDPDYVDSWYTLARGDNGTRVGARGNGRLTLEPYFVQEF
ncbi:DUF3103 family protein [Streptomyces naphthomycinicus]|uniref:DUF3103 family protein n=1 Tax=Streptomyces naphthomycinicus TaxID=2872625 RepID=UPI001CEC6C04|nr:DUF3103 family protein [Streptomyces sp. TML10]